MLTGGIDLRWRSKRSRSRKERKLLSHQEIFLRSFHPQAIPVRQNKQPRLLHLLQVRQLFRWLLKPQELLSSAWNAKSHVWFIQKPNWTTTSVSYWPKLCPVMNIHVAHICFLPAKKPRQHRHCAYAPPSNVRCKLKFPSMVPRLDEQTNVVIAEGTMVFGTRSWPRTSRPYFQCANHVFKKERSHLPKDHMRNQQRKTKYSSVELYFVFIDISQTIWETNNCVIFIDVLHVFIL